MNQINCRAKMKSLRYQMLLKLESIENIDKVCIIKKSFLFHDALIHHAKCLQSALCHEELWSIQFLQEGIC